MLRTTLPRTARIGRTHKLSAALVATASCAAAVALATPSQAATPAGHLAAATAADHIKVTAVATQAHTAKQAASKDGQQYGNNLDGWIRQSLDIMKSKGIPGSYEGLHRNIMRESSGNPNAVNGWDVNAVNGIPSKGLLQVIQPTFNTYHVAGTADNLTDPVANITAAANYAAARYGSIDNVNSAY
ncbi:transglycosylase SLT domain-containing protein [Streptomyces natalensis]|uniref:Lytic transglycosylase n=1 Tax=Streptomyces natalensis ATCC 27448 TaxID=1240678 RepID=A0A0D7CM47_9ACTN|nr:transglycosylase SLT domain-containing protein [Streptomyces natalensis]KIZ16935.1 lytic transglycosylase [Streptomyces natalensis ATCC 27448]